MRTNRHTQAACILVGILVLAGCASSDGSPFALEQSDSDVLPSVVPDEQYDADSVRFLGTSEANTSYYAARALGEDGAAVECLVAVRETDDWSSTCAPALPIEAQLDNGETAILHEKNGSANGTPIGDYLTVDLP